MDVAPRIAALRPSAERYGSLNRFCSQGSRPGLGSFVPLSGTHGQEIHYACPILAGRKCRLALPVLSAAEESEAEGSLRRGVYPKRTRADSSTSLGMTGGSAAPSTAPATPLGAWLGTRLARDNSKSPRRGKRSPWVAATWRLEAVGSPARDSGWEEWCGDRRTRTSDRRRSSWRTKARAWEVGAGDLLPCVAHCGLF